MKLLRVAFAALLALTPAAFMPYQAAAQSARSQAKAVTELLERDRFRFPARLGQLIRDRVVEYEDRSPGLGFSVRYLARTGHADIYVYDRQLKRSTAELTELLEREREIALDEIQAGVSRGVYKSADLHKSSDMRLPTGLVRTAELRIVGDGRKRDSFVLVTARKDRFVKIRYTMDPSPRSAREAETLMRNFLAAQGTS